MNLSYAKDPLRIIKSIYYSISKTDKSLVKMPISATWPTVLKVSKGAKINVAGRLVLGYFHTIIGENGQMKYDRTIVRLEPNSELTITGKVSLGPGVRVIMGENSRVRIGNGSFITSNSQLFCKESIEIGENCAISWGVQIMDTDFHQVIIDGEKIPNTAPVKIGNRVWIGSGVTILKGVRIGNGSIIGAGSVVTKDVPSNSLAVGNPAIVKRKDVDWEQ